MPFAKSDTDRYRCKVDIIGGKEVSVHCDIEELVDQQGTIRGKMWLNSGWERSTVESSEMETPPPETGWVKAALPDVMNSMVKGTVWWRKIFTPPDWLKGDRCVAHFQRAYSEADVFLNGKRIGYHLGPTSPFEVDLSKNILWDNEKCVIGGGEKHQWDKFDRFYENWSATLGSLNFKKASCAHF